MSDGVMLVYFDETYEVLVLNNLFIVEGTDIVSILSGAQDTCATHTPTIRAPRNAA